MCHDDKNIQKLVGIVSFGIDCGKFPGIYVRVSNYVDWIQNCSSTNSDSIECSTLEFAKRHGTGNSLNSSKYLLILSILYSLFIIWK